MDIENVDALDQADDVAQSDGQEGEDTKVSDGEGQDAKSEDDSKQPEPEISLVELPDGRKVTPLAAVEEYKKLQADYTKKSQRVKELEKAQTAEPKPWQKKDYQPQTWEEVIDSAKREAIHQLQEEQKEAETQRQVADSQLEAEIAGIKKTDPDVNSDAVLDFANKRTEKLGIKYPNFTAAYYDYKNLKDEVKKTEKLTEKRAIENQKKRNADVVSAGKSSSGGSNANFPKGASLYDKAQIAWQRLQT